MPSTQLVAPVDSPQINSDLVRLGQLASESNALAISTQRESDEHLVAAGQHLANAKKIVKNTAGLTWSGYLEQCCSTIGRRRADELIMVAESRITLVELRASKARSVAKVRNLKKAIVVPATHAQPQYLSSIRILAANEMLRELSYDELDELLVGLEIFEWRPTTCAAKEFLPKFSAKCASKCEQPKTYEAVIEASVSHI